MPVLPYGSALSYLSKRQPPFPLLKLLKMENQKLEQRYVNKQKLLEKLKSAFGVGNFEVEVCLQPLYR